MVLLSFFNTVEFYVIAVIVAAAIVAYFALPRDRGAARQFLLPSKLSMSHSIDDEVARLTIEALADGTVTLRRTGLVGLTEAGALSVAIEVKGFDIEIKERVTYDPTPSWPVNTAELQLDFLASERYHIHYWNPDTGATAATSFHNRPGIVVTKVLES